MTLRFEIFRGAEIAQVVDDLARLRIEVFRDWPYLYDGDLDYERSYLARYAAGQSVMVAAYDGLQMVGASTGLSLMEHAKELSTSFDQIDVRQSEIFYCAESVLLRQHHGQGAGRKFFADREAHAHAHGFTYTAFASVVRPLMHPARPASYRPLDPFWRSLNYAPVEGAITHLSWRDAGKDHETEKPLQIWMKQL